MKGLKMENKPIDFTNLLTIIETINKYTTSKNVTRGRQLELCILYDLSDELRSLNDELRERQRFLHEVTSSRF